jgi:hypothetical protein
MGGYMNGKWQIVHGADAQRSDRKSEEPTKSSTRTQPQGGVKSSGLCEITLD